MGLLGNIKTRNKLVLGFGVIMVLLAAVIIVALVQISAINRSQTDLAEHDFRLSIAVEQARSDLNRIRAEILNMLVDTDSTVQAASEQEIEARLASIEALLPQIKTILTMHGDSNTAAAMANVDQILPEYKQTTTQVLQLIQQGDADGAQVLAVGVQYDRMEQMRTDLLKLAEHSERNVTAAVADSQSQLDTTILVVALLGGLALVVAIFMIWVMNQLIAVPLGRTAQMAQQMGRGELDTRLKLGRKDEIGTLASTMDQLADIVKDLVRETVTLAEAASRGRLSARGDADKYEGAYRDVVLGVNQTMDAVVGPLNAAAAYIDRIAQDEIPRPLSDTFAGDFDLLRDNLNKMADNLRGLNEELSNGFGVLASSSTEILATVSQLAAGASETAASVSETSATAAEVRQTAQLSAQKAKNVRETAERTTVVSAAGRKAVEETMEGMRRIDEQMESIADTVVRLSEQGQAISEIIATVNDIAEESNVLAVNAAIEATRAGEYGKGFAVVAQEMKGLAEQSRSATAQVRTILMEVQKATSAAVMSTEQGSKAVSAGVKQAAEAGESIRTLTNAVSEAAQAAIQISASTEQQLVGLEQIASAIGNIEQATVQNVAGTKQLEISARDLQELGGRLKVVVERQKVEK